METQNRKLHSICGVKIEDMNIPPNVLRVIQNTNEAYLKSKKDNSELKMQIFRLQTELSKPFIFRLFDKFK